MDLRKLQPNIYPPAWDAVSRMDSFPWHGYSDRPHSSQAFIGTADKALKEEEFPDSEWTGLGRWVAEKVKSAADISL